MCFSLAAKKRGGSIGGAFEFSLAGSIANGTVNPVGRAPSRKRATAPRILPLRCDRFPVCIFETARVMAGSFGDTRAPQACRNPHPQSSQLPSVPFSGAIDIFIIIIIISSSINITSIVSSISIISSIIIILYYA